RQAPRRPSSKRRAGSGSSIRARSSSSSRASRPGCTRRLRSRGVDDRAIVERQLGRPPRALRRVVVRCPFGLPAVTEQEPYDAAGEPFPTTYYLTCPHLVAAVARLEAAGGVERWSASARAEPALAASLRRADEEQRRLRRELAG